MQPTELQKKVIEDAITLRALARADVGGAGRSAIGNTDLINVETSRRGCCGSLATARPA
jgi:hypothetical protein